MRGVIYKSFRLISLLVLPHIVVISHYILKQEEYRVTFMIITASLFLVFFLGINFYIRKEIIPIPLRLRIMISGRSIFLDALVLSTLQIPLCIFLILKHQSYDMAKSIVVADTVTTFALLLFIQVNGAIRIMFSSRRLGLSKRVIFLLFSWIPPINIFLGIWFCRIVKREYDYNYIQIELQNTRVKSQICSTKYPLFMLHGFGFRDGKYLFNYWGRIPKLLKENGSVIFYGKQQANAPIEENAEEIKKELKKIINDTGCGKVNIIAHSKGGLDARYMVSSLGMEDYVASLTTVSTPHRGSELLNVLKQVPDKKYRRICSGLDRTFRLLGDTKPDTYKASRQLSPEFMQQFNIDNPDSGKVYYQSYAGKMKGPASSPILLLPNAIMKYLADDNDGLVTIDSAKWGTFKGTLESSTHRGISHADQIDLFHQEHEGFNIREEYVQIVKELKDMGY